MKLVHGITTRRMIRSLLARTGVPVDPAGQSGQPEESLFVELLRTGHSAKMIAYGTSMFPSILPGQLVELAPKPFEAPPLGVGDIVLVDSPAGLVLHRFISHHGQLLLFKGDSVRGADPLVFPDQMIGRVTRVGSSAILPLSRLGRLVGRVWAGASRAHWRFHGSSVPAVPMDRQSSVDGPVSNVSSRTASS
jgi:hypothetical protein